jgi:hypothetical protein
MESLQTGLSATPFALTVELDLQQVLSGERPPSPLSRAQAEELTGAIAEDLVRILGDDVRTCGLITVGALYDMSEIIRPGLPIVETLFELYRGSLPGGVFAPQLMAIGASNGRFPIPTIAPLRRPGSGPLLILPLLFVGEQDAVKDIQRRLEAELLEKGRAEFKTDFCVRRLFGVQPENLAYATFNDLCALLKIQLDHGGLSPLWELLEGALFRPEDSQEVRLESGNHFIQRGSAVYSPFYTFDQWAARSETDRARPLETYFEWVKRQRTIEAGLSTHGLEVHHLRADAPLESGCGNKLQRLAEHFGLEGTVLTEVRTSGGGLAGASVVLLTEQASPALGLLAYTVLVQAADGSLLHLANEYPLTAQAAGEVRQKWAAVATDLGLELHLSRPGRILVSDDQRHLSPDLGEDG